MLKLPLRFRPILLAALGALLAAPNPAVASHLVPFWRPLVADPRETQFRMKWVSFTEDWRYGADITDSTSRGGVRRDYQGVYWDVGFGETFHFVDSRRAVTPIGKFFRTKRYQIGIPAGLFADFYRAGGELVNADYQFGLALDCLHTDAWKDGLGVTGFEKPVVTSRVMLYHRSTHLGDEYLANAAFGRNRRGLADSADLFPFPPVKRVNLSFEALRGILSTEWAPRLHRNDNSTVRVYAAAEIKPGKLFTHNPPNFRSPIGQLGFEYRSQGNARRPHPSPISNALHVIKKPCFVTEYFAACDLKLAKPYDFASADNPTGSGEVWTPHLWSAVPYGHEFDHYAGSWHAMLGITLYEYTHRVVQSEAAASHDDCADKEHGDEGHMLAPYMILALDWYRGYSPNGQLLDQRLRYRPFGYVAPSITVHF